MIVVVLIRRTIAHWAGMLLLSFFKQIKNEIKLIGNTLSLYAYQLDFIFYARYADISSIQLFVFANIVFL